MGKDNRMEDIILIIVPIVILVFSALLLPIHRFINKSTIKLLLQKYEETNDEEKKKEIEKKIKSLLNIKE